MCDVVEKEVLKTRKTETWLGLVTRGKKILLSPGKEDGGGKGILKIKN